MQTTGSEFAAPFTNTILGLIPPHSMILQLEPIFPLMEQVLLRADVGHGGSCGDMVTAFGLLKEAEIFLELIEEAFRPDGQ